MNFFRLNGSFFDSSQITNSKLRLRTPHRKSRSVEPFSDRRCRWTTAMNCLPLDRFRVKRKCEKSCQYSMCDQALNPSSRSSDGVHTSHAQISSWAHAKSGQFRESSEEIVFTKICHIYRLHRYCY